ncbi:MAG: hypothetical protein HGA85_01600 [Nanoarchaeota archaeon]|nr:hypothetical protein [Nanoarchaeota archaeon]
MVKKGDSPGSTTPDIVGGKGYNLLRLAELADALGYKVADFEIIPVCHDYNLARLKGIFDSLQKPIILRSSSPLEDGMTYSYSGRFDSIDFNTHFENHFIPGIQCVIDSAAGEKAAAYAAKHGLTLDNRMAVIAQEQKEFQISGVSYTDVAGKVIIEFVNGNSAGLMDGRDQGQIAVFDKELNPILASRESLGDFICDELRKIAQISCRLQEAFGYRLDLEFGIEALFDGNIYINQARPITEPCWPEVDLGAIPHGNAIMLADVVKGAGNFTGPVYVMTSPDLTEKLALAGNRNPRSAVHEQYNRLREFDQEHTEGYCLLSDTLFAHEHIIGKGLKNLKAVITVNYASRFSHPAAVVSETGAFYLGARNQIGLLGVVETGDTISVAADQFSGILFNHIPKKKPDWNPIDISLYQVVPLKEGLTMQNPAYENVDDHIFLDANGNGVRFVDYNSDEMTGIPEWTSYFIIKKGLEEPVERIYEPIEVVSPYMTFPLMLSDILRKII